MRTKRPAPTVSATTAPPRPVLPVFPKADPVESLYSGAWVAVVSTAQIDGDVDPDTLPAWRPLKKRMRDLGYEPINWWTGCLGIDKALGLPTSEPGGPEFQALFVDFATEKGAEQFGRAYDARYAPDVRAVTYAYETCD